MRKPRKKPEGAPQKSRLEVFVSYAREDAALVAALTGQIRRCFNALQVDFFTDSKSISDGDNFRTKIDEGLDQADILLIVSTGRQRESHDFPGFEVGFFSRSLKARRTVGGVERQIIPLVIGGKVPTAILDIQGVIIQPEQIFKFDVAPGDLSSEQDFRSRVAADDPFRKLLVHLRDLISRMSNIRLTSEDLRAWDQTIDECAHQIDKIVFNYLRDRVYAESYPERKLIIRTPLMPASAGVDDNLAASTIEFVGRSFEVFGLPEQPSEFTWAGFLAAINKTDIAMQWREGLRTLIAGALDGASADNYYFVSSLHGEQSFRLFVSLIRTYYSGQREIHIYIVTLARLKDYGDLKTTKLAKAVSVGLRYRSLFLEDNSPFSTNILSFCRGKELRAKITELWGELRHILAETRQARLDDPQLLSFIYGIAGHEQLDRLVVIWHDAESELDKVTHEIMAIDDDGQFDAKKSSFMAALGEFCSKTEEMNREFTSKALTALESEITQKLARPAAMAAPPKSAA